MVSQKTIIKESKIKNLVILNTEAATNRHKEVLGFSESA